jgi:hypothetical protein
MHFSRYSGRWIEGSLQTTIDAAACFGDFWGVGFQCRFLLNGLLKKLPKHPFGEGKWRSISISKDLSTEMQGKKCEKFAKN